MSFEHKHFYTVFNPMLGHKNPDYPTQAHEFYERLKIQWESKNNDPHMYWGKIRKTRTNNALNIEHFQSIIADNLKNKLDTHLYISDFNNFWVAKVEEVTTKIPSSFNTLELYKNEEVELWFKISEIDLIASNSKETNEFLSLLNIPELGIQSINPYLSGLRYPLIVRDSLNENYFFKNDETLSCRMLRDNPEITNSSSRVKSLITSYAIPEKNFNKLPSIIRNEILAAEIDYQDLKNNVGLKTNSMNKIACAYIQILEGILNATLVSSFKTKENITALKKLAKENPDLKIGDQFYSNRNLSLNDIENLIKYDTYASFIGFKKHLKTENKSMFCNFIKTELYEMLNIQFGEGFCLKEIRNDKVHLEGKIELTFEEALEIRNIILGVGCKGAINNLVEKWYFNSEDIKKLKAA